MMPQIQIEETNQPTEQTLPATNATAEKRSRKHWLALAIALIAMFALLGSGIWSRVKARTALNAETAQAAFATVSVVLPKQTALSDEVILPGNVQPFITSPIYARTNGYLRKWYF